MEAHLIALSRAIATPLARPDVDEHGPGNLQRRSEDVLHAGNVVARNDTQVCDAQILEELAGLGEVDDHSPNAARQSQSRLADDGERLDDSVVSGLALPPGVRKLESREVLAEGADARADRHGIVVEDDEQLSLAMADVVEGLQREPADQSRVPDDDRDPLH